MRLPSSLALVLALTSAAAEAQPPLYRVADIGSLVVGQNTFATGLNDQGQVVGDSTIGPAGPHQGALTHAFFWSNGLMTDLFPGDNGSSSATAINEAGKVVGYWRDTTTSPSQPFLWDGDGAPTILNPFGALPFLVTGAANGINDADNIVGVAMTPSSPFQSHAFRLSSPWSPGSAIDLTPTLSSPYFGSTAVALNNVGDLAGTLNKPGNNANNFDTSDSFYNSLLLDALLPAGSFEPRGINDAGQAAGFVYGGGQPARAVVYANGFTDLATLTSGGASRAHGINSAGHSVGTATDPSGAGHAVLWRDGAVYDLNASVPASAGVVLTEARGINDPGQIVAWGHGASMPSPFRSFLLTPVSPSDAVSDLITFIEGLGLVHGIENSLTAKLRNAQAALQAGDTAGACDLLAAFINEVEAQAGKKIDIDDAAVAIADATRVQVALGC